VSNLLGRTMADAGKAHVMMESARTASSAKFETISFNKYSGVQEWANAAAFLWINVGSPNADVVNEFSHQGRRINWFGGSRMYEHSNTVQNLIAAGTQKRSHRGPFGEKQPFSWSLNDGGGVVLWCRRYTPLRHTFEPYMCLGRLQVCAPIRVSPIHVLDAVFPPSPEPAFFICCCAKLVSWDAASHPIEFVWELVDYDKLWDHSDIAARYNFRSLVDSYSKNEEVDPAHVSSG
jgi:hypothetical protein